MAPVYLVPRDCSLAAITVLWLSSVAKYLNTAVVFKCRYETQEAVAQSTSSILNVAYYFKHSVNLNTLIYPTQGRINHSGAPYQRQAGALFSYAIPCRIFSLQVHFSSPEKLTTFLLVVVKFKPTLHVQTCQHNVVKFELIGGPLAAGAPSNGTTGTMDNPALARASTIDHLYFDYAVGLPNAALNRMLI